MLCSGSVVLARAARIQGRYALPGRQVSKTRRTCTRGENRAGGAFAAVRA
jgi:hypothetical protein